MNVGDNINTTDLRRSAPIGTVIHLRDNRDPNYTFTKTGDDEWTAGDGERRPNAVSGYWMDDGYGQYTVSAVGQGAVSTYSVGQVINTAADRTALPVGSVIVAHSQRSDGNTYHWTKTGPDEWIRLNHDRRVRRNERDAGGVASWFRDVVGDGYHIIALGNGAVVPPHIPVGGRVRTGADRVAMPVGSVIQNCQSTLTADTWTKTAENQWTAGDGARRYDTSGGWAEDNHHRTWYNVLSVLEVETAAFTVNQRIDSPAMRGALPVGAVIFHSGHQGQHNATWTKQSDGTWMNGQGTTRSRADVEWLADAHEAYVLESLPAVPPAEEEVEQQPLTYEGLLALAPESMFMDFRNQQVRWCVVRDQRAIRAGDGAAVRVPLATFEGAAVAGHLRLEQTVQSEEAAESPTVTHPVPVGSGVATSAQFEAMPVGTMIRVGYEDPYTKSEDGRWYPPRGGRGLGSPRTGHYFTVVSYPDTTAEAAPEFPLGYALQTREELVAVPVGTVVTTSGDDPDYHWERVPEGYRRMSSRYGGVVNEAHHMSTGGVNVVWRLASEFSVGQTVETSDFNRLPIGTVASSASGNGLWMRRFTDGWHTAQNRAITDGSIRGPFYSAGVIETLGDDTPQTYEDYRASLPAPAPPFVPTIGMDIETVEQYRALPIDSIVHGPSLAVIKIGDDRWWTLGAGRLPADGSTDEMMAARPRVLVSLPRVDVREVRAAFVAPGTNPAASGVDEAEVQRRSDAAVSDALSIERARVSTAFQEAWDGVSWTKSELNDVLDGLGIDGITETEEVAVTVMVTGTSTLYDRAVESMFEGSLSASLTDDVSAEWQMELEFDFEVEEGQCACHLVDRDDVVLRLENGGVTYDSFDYESGCPNH